MIYKYLIGLVLISIPLVPMGIAFYPDRDAEYENFHNRWEKCLEYDSRIIRNDCIGVIFDDLYVTEMPITQEEFDYYIGEEIEDGYFSFYMLFLVVYVVVTLIMALILNEINFNFSLVRDDY